MSLHSSWKAGPDEWREPPNGPAWLGDASVAKAAAKELVDQGMIYFLWSRVSKLVSELPKAVARIWITDCLPAVEAAEWFGLPPCCAPGKELTCAIHYFHPVNL